MAMLLSVRQPTGASLCVIPFMLVFGNNRKRERERVEGFVCYSLVLSVSEYSTNITITETKIYHITDDKNR